MRTDGRTSSRVLWVRHPLALGRSDAVNSDGYLACEPAVRQAFHTGVGATSGLQAVGDRHQTPRAAISDSRLLTRVGGEKKWLQSQRRPICRRLANRTSATRLVAS